MISGNGSIFLISLEPVLILIGLGEISTTPSPPEEGQTKEPSSVLVFYTPRGIFGWLLFLPWNRS